MQSVPKIDLHEYQARIFTGRNNGRMARDRFQVKRKFKEAEYVDVEVPRDTMALNSSFLLGMLGDEMAQCGSRDAFLKRFHFHMPEKFNMQLNLSIDRALFEHATA